MPEHGEQIFRLFLISRGGALIMDDRMTGLRLLPGTVVSDLACRSCVLTLLASLLFLSACSQPKVDRFDPLLGATGDAPLVWPSPPDPPRLRYAGQLVGEYNFPLEDRAKSLNRFGETLAWLVGLGLEERRPDLLERPISGLVDGAERVLVTDMGRKAVFVFDIIGKGYQIWEKADAFERFHSPVAITQGVDGGFLVTDSELGIVVRLAHDGQPIDSFGKGVLLRPTGIVRDPVIRRTYVADTHAHDVKVFDDNGVMIDAWGGGGATPGTFNSPTHLALRDGLLYVTDTLNARVQVFSQEGELIRHFGRRGLNFGDFVRPKGVAVDQEHRVYVIESFHDYLLIFDQDGRFLMPLGGEGSGPGQFNLPAGELVVDHGQIYVADMYNSRFVVFQLLEVSL